MNLIRHSPYHHRFVSLGAEFVDRLGMAAPLRFTTTAEEHKATREAVGLFDVYYQVAIEVAGQGAVDLLRWHLVADVAALAVGRVVYSSLCNAAGGMIDDLTCFRLEEDRFWLFPTPSRVANAIAALSPDARRFGAVVSNLGYKSAYLSVQGPKSRELLGRLTSADLSTAALPTYAFTTDSVADIPGAIIARTGFSGELGYELFYPSECAEHLWDSVMDAGADLGATPCGLGALRSLRMEKKYPIYGLDLDETTSPFEAGVGWTVKLDRPDFVAKAALEKQKREGVARRLMLIEFPDMTTLPARGDAILAGDRSVGTVSSADRGYTVEKTLALGYVVAEAAVDGQAVSVGGVAAVLRAKGVYDATGSRLKS